MNEHERRYRSSIGKSSSEQARARYKQAAQRPTAPRQPQKQGRMTYDEYLAQVSDDDKIIEVNNDSKVERALDFLETYFGWLKRKKQKYAPIAKSKLKTGAKTAVRNQPLSKERLKNGVKRADGLLSPLKQRFGAQNVYFGLLTSTMVLVLLGGFLLIRGGEEPAETEVVVTETGLGQVQGAETTEPDFDIVLPEERNTDSQIFFDANLGVASFQDRFNEHTFTISQQPLTDDQKANREDQLDLVAVNLLAEISFETQFGTTYVSNTAPDGTPSQVAIFMTEELLIFIRTSGTSLPAEQWVEYINTIQS